MYEKLKSLIVQILKVEATQPHPPAGYDPHELMRVERAAPSFLAFRLVLWKLYALVWVIGVVTYSVVMAYIEPRWLYLLIPLVPIAVVKIAILYVVSRLDYEMRWYVITERSLLIRQGVWNVSEITLTFANAQNVRVTQGPVERLFGFSNVEVDTAGGGGKTEEKGGSRHKAVLRGLANPAEVRDLILELLRHHRTAGLGDPDDWRGEGRLPGGGIGLSPELVAQIYEEAKGMRLALAGREK